MVFQRTGFIQNREIKSRKDENNGQWTMDNGQWRIENCQLSIVNCQLL